MPRITSLPPTPQHHLSTMSVVCVKQSCNRAAVKSCSLLTKVSSSLNQRCLVFLCISTLLLGLFSATAVGENAELAAIRPSTATAAQQPHEREASLLLCPQGKMKTSTTRKYLVSSPSLNVAKKPARIPFPSASPLYHLSPVPSGCHGFFFTPTISGKGTGSQQF